MMKRITFFVLKVLRYGLIALIALLVLAVLILLEENQRGKWAWEKYKREAEARGVSFDPRQFIPPPVPDDQNFAMTPLLKPLFGADREYRESLAKRLGLTNPEANVATPQLLGMRDGRHTDLAKWREYLGQPDILQVLKKFDPELDEISAATRRPFARFPLRYEDGVSCSVRQLGALLNLSKLYELRALAALEAGQTERALADVESIFKLAESTRDEPLLISQLLRESLSFIGMQVVWEGLEAHRWSESQLVVLQGCLERIDLLTGTLRALRYEQARLPEATHAVFNDPELFAHVLEYRECLSINALPWYRLRLFLKYTEHRSLLVACCFGDEYVLPVIDPARQLVDVGKTKEGEQKLQAMLEKLSLYTLLTWLDSSKILTRFSKLAHTQTTVNQAVIACALERYRLAHGVFPDKLDALVPQYLAKLPHDIINGQPLHYRRTDDGLFVLYSVGWNETDDHGEVGMDVHHFPDIKQGDWVWRYSKSE